MTDKQRKAEYLLNEIGNLDEDLLHEATDLYPAARRRQKKQWMITAVCAVCACAILIMPVGAMGSLLLALGTFIGINVVLPFDKSDSSQSTPPPEQNVTEVAPEELDVSLFFGGEPLLISKAADEDFYRVTVLDDKQLNEINRLKKNSSKRTESDPLPETEVWICDGKGLVTTPYLESTPGNEYYGTLFDYDPELVLSQELTAYLADLTS